VLFRCIEGAVHIDPRAVARGLMLVIAAIVAGSLTQQKRANDDPQLPGRAV